MRIGAICGGTIAPLNPPLPTAMNFPFHPDAGIQTSILMSESLDGVSRAATRQNAGRRFRISALNGPGAPGCAGGCGNCPAATACAIVIVVFGRVRLARLSHVAANEG